jgi:hypothetical protein
MLAIACCLFAATAAAQSSPDPHCPQTTSGLYDRIRTVGLDSTRVYHVREATIHRPNLDLTLDDGTIAFTEDICGHITGAFFDGDGEILLQPPNRVERGSMALFTGTAILEEQFSSGYLRFNDDTAELLKPSLSPVPDPDDFVKQWSDAALKLAPFDGLRFLMDFSHFLPTRPANAPDRKFPPILHVHLLGKTLGAFEVFWDAALAEPLWAGQVQVKDGMEFFDIWTSFTPPMSSVPAATPRGADVSITAVRIHASVDPPTQLQASSEVDVRVRNGGQRMLLFELSRYLKIDSLEADGHPVDFIQNPAIEGTELHRKGNDMVAVVFSAELKNGQELKLRFRYGGEVLSEAGNGLLYVGARGTWYPSFGLNPATFDMEFRYPAIWTLVATGKQVPRSSAQTAQATPEMPGETISHWVSERPIPVAGFNLGKYVRAEARTGNILVEAYGTKGVETAFPKAPTQVIQAPDPSLFPHSSRRSRAETPSPIVVTPARPSPARDLQAVADRAANAITSFSQWFGPYPYGSLAFTQMPGDLSQGWPGLVFLSSFAFLSPQEQSDMHLSPVMRELNTQVLVHETAHQWWGDLVLWKSYHDQWLAEGLANYSSLLVLEQQNPAQFRQVLEKYRSDLAGKNKDDELLRDAGPVTLGSRLSSSHFPAGYDAISYERGTWLFHMLRSMLRDAEFTTHSRKGTTNPDEPFFRALRKARERFAGKTMSTRDLIQVFEEELPRPLWNDNHHKLDWFVDGWINGTALPELSSRDVHFNEKAGTTTIAGVIVQKDAPDDLITAVPVYGETSSNTQILLGQVLADGRETAFHLTAPVSVHKILLDPQQTILTAPK